VLTDSSLLRPSDLSINWGNPQKAKEKLGWQAKWMMPDVVKAMMSHAQLSLN
jgi:GDPmannose 4,6-dehydratase